MKTFLFFTILLIIACAPIWVIASEMKRLTVCWEAGLKPPYLMKNENTRLKGIAVEAVTEILVRNHIEVEHIVRPHKRCELMMKHGEVQILPNYTWRQSHTEYALYTEPLYETHLVLFYRKAVFPTPPQIHTSEELKQYIVGGVKGFNYSWYKGIIHLDTGALTRRALISKLKLDRVQLALAQKEVLMMMQHRGEVDLRELGFVPDPVRPVRAYRILVGKSYPYAQEAKRILDGGIAALKQDGTFDKIVASYLGTE